MLPPLPAIGAWHLQDFTAAVATATRILAAPDQGKAVTAFLHAALGATVAAMRRK